MRKITLTVAAGLLLALNSANAQLDKISFLNGGVNDGRMLFKAYLDPWAKSIGAGLDAGWYNSAKPHSLFGFDVTLTTSMAFAPSSERTFNVNELGLKELTLKTGSNPESQTIAGKSTQGAELQVKAGGQVVGSFKTPEGTGFAGVPLPMVKVGFGLPFGTEIDARFLPTLSFGNKVGSIGLWGVGFKHSIKQWIPVVSLVPFWDMSLVGGYSHFSTSADVRFTPKDLNKDIQYADFNESVFDGQKATFGVSAWNVGMVVGTNLPIFNVYGGIGYSSTQADLAFKGRFYQGGATLKNNQLYVEDKHLSEVPTTDFDKFANMKYTAGMRVKLALLTIHADYSYADYSIYTAGIGLSFR